MKVDSLLYQEENSTTKIDIDRRYYLNFCFEQHIHGNPEFIYVTKGEMIINVEGNVMSIPEEHFCIVLPWQVHSFSTPVYSRSMILVTSGYYVDSFLRNVSGMSGVKQVFQAEEWIRSLFLKYLYTGPFPDEYIISVVLLALCHAFIANCPLQPRFAGSKRSKLDDVMHYISNNHSSQSLTLKEVADAVGYSYYHVSHLFKNYIGMSFPQFLNMVRLGHARSLLIRSHKSMTDICFEAGFQSIHSFNRIFKSKFGVTPSEYRIRHTVDINGERISIDEGMVQHDSGIL